MSEPPPRTIALLGLSGVGKSSLGRLLAARLGWPLRDTDQLIVAAAGRSVADIFAEQGEEHFRDLEAAALRQALGPGPAVVATGGGIVLREENRTLLRRCARCVWLDASTAQLVARLRVHSQMRPLLAGTTLDARLEELRIARLPLYSALADLQINTDDHTPEAVTDLVLTQLGERMHL